MSKKHKEWLVRWKGFSHEDDTWELLEHLSGCKHARFEEERDRKQAEDDDAQGRSPAFSPLFTLVRLLFSCAQHHC